MTHLQQDARFKNLDCTKVKQVFVLCGANDVDRVLGLPKQAQSEFLNASRLKIHEGVLGTAKSDFTQLADYLNSWAKTATVNFINILPRESCIRNTVINMLNCHIKHMENQKHFVRMVSTELNRNLFSFKNGYRKSNYFSNNGHDNVHLNRSGVGRLARHLKYLAHNK